MNSTSLSRRRAAAVAVICASLAFASCSSDGTVTTPGDDTSTAPGSTPAADEPASAAPAPAANTTYLDRFVNDGVLYNPFYGDALGGDIGYAEPACEQALRDVAAFGAARGGNASSVSASFAAVSADIPANVAAGLQEWDRFIAAHSATYNGPFNAVGQGVYDDETLRSTLTNPDVIDMLDEYRALDMIPPNDFLSFLDASCTRTSQ